MPTAELLCPAGDLERLMTAVEYGADAVYIAGKSFGLRANAGNFSQAEMIQGVQYAHTRGVRVYCTLNVLARQEDLPLLPAAIHDIAAAGVDAVIVADPGIMDMVCQHAPHMPLHLSTQASCTNAATARFWARQGISRIVLSRELSITEIAEIHDMMPGIELEAFVHGAICIAHSGRCLMSAYMAGGRDANRGNCAQPCRWNYAVMEGKRPDEYWPVEEDARGSYVFNSKDMMMINHLDALWSAGVSCFKIEGRMKTMYYGAVVTRAYRRAVDMLCSSHWQPDPAWETELQRVSHRPFTTNFYFENPGARGLRYDATDYLRGASFCGVVRQWEGYEGGKADGGKAGRALVEQRGLFEVGETLEWMNPHGADRSFVVSDLWDEAGTPCLRAPHAQQLLWMETPCELLPGTILRRNNVDFWHDPATKNDE